MPLETTQPTEFTEAQAEELVARVRVARRTGHDLKKQLSPDTFDAEALIRRLIDEGKIEVYNRT